MLSLPQMIACLRPAVSCRDRAQNSAEPVVRAGRTVGASTGEAFRRGAAASRWLRAGKRAKPLLADEPTGNLDVATAEAVFAELLAIVRDHGLAALIATHNSELAARWTEP